MNRFFLLLLASIFVACTAFAEDKTGSDRLVKLEADFPRATAEGGQDAFVSWFADDGVELENGGGISTKQEMLKEGPWPPDLPLSWTPVRAEMASSGDLGFTDGNYVLKSKN